MTNKILFGIGIVLDFEMPFQTNFLLSREAAKVAIMPWKTFFVMDFLLVNVVKFSLQSFAAQITNDIFRPLGLTMKLSIDKAHVLGHGKHVGVGVVLAPVVVKPAVPLLLAVNVNHMEFKLGTDGVLIAADETDVDRDVVAKVVPVFHVDLHVIRLDIFVVTKLALSCFPGFVDSVDMS